MYPPLRVPMMGVSRKRCGFGVRLLNPESFYRRAPARTSPACLIRFVSVEISAYLILKRFRLSCGEFVMGVQFLWILLWVFAGANSRIELLKAQLLA